MVTSSAPRVSPGFGNWAAAVVVIGVASMAHCCPAQESPNSDYYDIGDIHREVTTSSPLAQHWFDRGLAMCYGFNHEEAVRCFERAMQADPAMPMAYWGLAYAWGPNINNMEIVPHQIAQAELAIRMAKLHAAHGSELERALIDALAQRYAVPVPEDREPLNRAYSDAMRQLHREHHEDPDVAALFAESLMNLQPWKHWTPEGQPGPHTQEIVAVLEKAMERRPRHPALCHLYIHTMEASPEPEKAVPQADRLRDRYPGLGHLLHMPSHIDVLVGDYAKVIDANRKAIEADDVYAKREGAFNFYTLYRVHNYHFLVYGAMFDGQSEVALQAARRIPEQVPEAMLRAQSDFIDAFVPTDLHVLVRFGRWEEILRAPEPPDYLPVSRSVRRYARALAFAATSRVADARREQQAFLTEKARVPDSSFLFQNKSQDILAVAEVMIAGEIAYREGRFELAFDRLREAVRRDDALNYDEPWGWMQPTRHALGALLLEQGKVAESERVFREDLERHPNNPWALHGLAESLRRQGHEQAANEWASRFTTATKRADVKIDRSCFCRRVTD